MEVSEQIKIFKEFIEKNYEPQLLETVRKGDTFLVFDFSELTRFNTELADELLANPEEVLKAGELAVKEFDLPKRIERFYIRFKNLPEGEKIMVSDIRSKHLTKFLWTEGIVRQKSDVRPHVMMAKFECPSCGNILKVMQSESKFREPSRCGCGRKGKFKELSKELIDGQGIVLEEAPEDLDGGEQQKRMNVFLKNDLVSPITEKKTNPGSKVRVIGWVSEIPIELRTGGKSTKFDLLIEANYIEPVQEDFSSLEISDEEIKKIEELSKDPKIFEKLTTSLAPSIFGHDKVKEALVLQLVGGVRKERKDGVITRGDMHVLLIGDPGAGKSQLLKRLNTVAPKARYVSGKGVSGAGLTASVVRDEFLGGWSLEAGALVLANKGFCVTEDTEIMINNSKILTAKELYENLKNNESVRTETKAISFNEDSFSIQERAIKNVSSRLSNDVYELKFSSGDILKITGEHPLPTWEDGLVWKEVKNIKEKELLIDFRDYKIKKNSFILVKENGSCFKFDEKFAELLGLLITDGNISLKKYKITFYTKSQELEEKFIELSEKIFKKKPSIYIDLRSDVKHLYLCSKKIVNKLNRLGIPKGNKTTQKINLNLIKNSPPNIIKAFLVGVINGDGSISNKKSGGSIDIVSGNESFIEELKGLFRKLGIIGTISKINHIGGGEVKKGNYKIFKLTISGVNNITRINDSRLITYKRKNLEKIKNRRNGYGNIKKINCLIKKINSELKHTHKKIFYKNNIKCSQLSRLGVSRKNLKKSIKELSKLDYIKNNNSFELIKKIVEKNIYFNKLISKKKIKPQTVYNIEIEKDSTYFANFIPVHNCMIDELDKMSKEDRSAMHEALEGQSVSISKANIQATLRAETTVLAAANPKFGRFDPYDPIASQINLPPTLINRFDLIFPIKDMPDKSKDKQMAEHILRLHQNPDEIDAEIETDLLKKFIAYARKKCKPAISQEALEEIRDYYIKMRSSGNVDDGGIKSIPITARQLEALVRLAEASAKIRLSKTVTKEDSKKSIELINYCLSQVAKDSETGLIDIDLISSGIPAKERNKISIVKDIVDELEREIGKTIPIESLMEKAEAKGLKSGQVEEIIGKLRRSGDLYEPRRGFLSKI